MHDGTNIDLSCINGDLLTHNQIFYSLARINRYDGATRRPYSVGEHTYRGAENYIRSRMFEAAWSFLWHDAHESLIGDIASPVGNLPELKKPVAMLKWRVDLVIERRFKVRLRGKEGRPVASNVEMDIAMLHREWDALMPAVPLDVRRPNFNGYNVTLQSIPASGREPEYVEKVLHEIHEYLIERRSQNV